MVVNGVEVGKEILIRNSTGYISYVRGENPFTALQIPYAITVLKQGAGRLIRDVADRGVLMIGDNRLTSSSYGKVFIRSLPPMRRTSDIDDVEIFFS